MTYAEKVARAVTVACNNGHPEGLDYDTLASLTDIPRWSISQAVRQAKDRGLVSLRPDPSDRRIKIVSLP